MSKVYFASAKAKKWKYDDSMPGKRSLAEAAKAVFGTFKEGKIIYINFLTEIQPECDYMPVADVPVIQDQGILISDDMVAVEQASVDMLLKAPPLPQAASEEKDIVKGLDSDRRGRKARSWKQGVRTC